MSKVFIGSIINGYKILKKIFNSIIPNQSIYKVKCVICGTIRKLRLVDIEKKACCKKESNASTNKESVVEKHNNHFSRNPEENIGLRKGKYVVVGYLHDGEKNLSLSIKQKRKLYIVKCLLCGELCIMSSNNMNAFREKRDKNTMCNHKVFFDGCEFDPSQYYINWELVNELEVK